MLTTQHGNVEAMRILIDRGADVHMRTRKYFPLSAIAARTESNADAVWDVLLAPKTGLTDEEKPSCPSLMISEALDGYRVAGIRSDDKALAAVIRHGADWRLLNADGDSVLHALMRYGAPDPNPVLSRLRTKSFAKIICHTLEAGVSPLIKDSKGVPACEAALGVPEFEKVFADACKPLAEKGLANSSLTSGSLVADNKLTDLALYCTCAGMLGDALSRSRWDDARALINVKQALALALPASYQRQYAADLDSSQQVRDGVSFGNSTLLKRLLLESGRQVQ